MGALAGWNAPDLSAFSSARMTCTTALHDVRAGGTAGADIMRIAQARAKSMATGTGLLTMSRTGE